MQRRTLIRTNSGSVDEIDGAACVTDVTKKTFPEIYTADISNDDVIPVGIILVAGKTRLSFSLDVFDNALAAFEVRYKFSEDDLYASPRASIAADYTTPNNPVIKASASLVTLAVGTNGWCQLDVGGIYAVEFWAKSSSANKSRVRISGSVA